MKVLIDTNIILDLLCDRKGFSDNANQIFRLCEAGIVDGFVSALSIPNIVYILRKELNTDRIREVVGLLDSLFTITDLTARELKLGVKMDFADYEDALQCVSAKKSESKYIITRNIKDYENSTIKAIAPSEFLKIIEADG